MNLIQEKKYKIATLIVAAGIGNRCNFNIPKQYIKLDGYPMLWHSIKKFLTNQYIDYIRVIIHKNHSNLYQETINHFIDISPICNIGILKTQLLPIQIKTTLEKKLLSPIYGGDTRYLSVKLGLESLQKIEPFFVIIHDACRPFLGNILINNIVQSMIRKRHMIEGIVPVIAVEDTTASISNDIIQGIIPRHNIRNIQTPQIFNFKTLLSCYKSNHDLSNHSSCQLAQDFTDDSSLMIACKKKVMIITGEKSNFKLTTKEDLHIAHLLFEKSKFRIGHGYDIHRFIKNNDEETQYIRICGVQIEHNMSIESHSDGDVAIHAIVDAILGALGCGDIGEYFPSDSLKWKNYNSLYFLYFVVNLSQEKGYIVSNLDITIVCETPIISPYKKQMKKIIAHVLDIQDESVNIKATTAEQLGSLGRSEGIKAYASVLLLHVSSLRESL
ncbi:2-C-methyl-D-erythritol 2,4-cyclodiphosphate synthase [Wolbachia endosymbiont of Howardula sp.]|uniref:2-C-methyl-D-erythritol 2,4-cyclodiphosphate synthase n=1 Tax=Wolbachia endosymbiont of Howardula sp. TaxID=2916816 RepID=UPI00217EEE1E|nr:2-C-methyl-D-erythritol 2,4-cyclodiphosphate synthase [Wolbachia endosymbiont of Howardula sp.]UWI83271.1 2-C-methyl-D-erythritol 2,4-cyclodiphosphate synthase [Wolbachia endosymbiont of Howardula sp.]